MRIVLASNSPRRKELLSQIGIDFDIIVSNEQERITNTIPAKVVEELSYQKANSVIKKLEAPVLVIGADTVVSYANKILGKPKDKKEAYDMIKMLQGNTHDVWTGVTILEKEELNKVVAETFSVVTKVIVYPMTETEINEYINSDEPYDKAGGYGIQGKFGAFIKEIQGDYNNVVGLPLSRVYTKLQYRQR